MKLPHSSRDAEKRVGLGNGSVVSPNLVFEIGSVGFAHSSVLYVLPIIYKDDLLLTKIKRQDFLDCSRFLIGLSVLG